jgi:hypothetical protein
MKPDWFTKTLLIAILIAQLFILLRPHPALVMAQGDDKKQQPQPNNAPAPRFENLRVFAYPNGLTGVFDATDGKLYLYDANLERALHIRQLNKLGENMQRVR